MLGLITATHNSISTLGDSLASVDMVSGRVKHFFIDGASTDGTVEFLNNFADNTDNAVVQTQCDAGLYQALNQGIQVAMDDPGVTHIGFLHSDDRLLPDSYGEYLSKIEIRTEEIFYSDIEFHDSFGNVARVWQSGKFSKFKLNTGWMPPHTSMIVAKSVYQDLGLYYPNFGTAADYEWIVRVLSARSDSVYYFPKRTLTMLVGGASSAGMKARFRANAMDGEVWAGRSRMQAAMIRALKPMRKLRQFVVLKGSK